MQVIVRKWTPDELMRLACSYTSGTSSKMTAEKMYRCEHSPMRVLMYTVELINIPTFVSVHFVRHKINVEHFVRSNRDDRGGSSEVDRETPISHLMFLNSQALINMARKRLCYQAHEKTIEVMQMIKDEVQKVDPDLAKRMVPECIYRGGYCHELRMCGKMPGIKRGE